VLVVITTIEFQSEERQDQENGEVRNAEEKQKETLHVP
jgi:hypothetical protein